MTITKQQLDELQVILVPVMNWLLQNTHPHCTLLVDSHRAELVEGLGAVVRRYEKPGVVLKEHTRVFNTKD